MGPCCVWSRLLPLLSLFCFVSHFRCVVPVVVVVVVAIVAVLVGGHAGYQIIQVCEGMVACRLPFLCIVLAPDVVAVVAIGIVVGGVAVVAVGIVGALVGVAVVVGAVVVILLLVAFVAEVGLQVSGSFIGHRSSEE